ncbi:MAG: NAD(P)H-quinone oxidoreductase [Chloroflexota bacterium]
MRAVIAQDKQPVLVDIPQPEPAADEILVKVHATALNRADLLQVGGGYPPPPGAPDTLGLELAGEVATVGADVTTFTVGQRLMALVGGGGYAEYATVAAAHALPTPDSLSDIEAGALMEAFLTAYTNMFDMGRLAEGETVLIHAGASGVGLAAMQMAKHIGATVIVTASAGKHELCREMGADMCIDYKTENFAERIAAEHKPGVDLVLEMVGAPYWDDNIRVLNKWGRLVFIGLMGGAKKEVNFGHIMGKRLSIMGSTLRNRTHERKADLIARFGEWALPLFADGTLKTTIYTSMPLEQVARAHDLMKSNANAGKIVLTLTA